MLYQLIQLSHSLSPLLLTQHMEDQNLVSTCVMFINTYSLKSGNKEKE